MDFARGQLKFSARPTLVRILDPFRFLINLKLIESASGAQICTVSACGVLNTQNS
jgi:hypothetical protein